MDKLKFYNTLVKSMGGYFAYQGENRVIIIGFLNLFILILCMSF